jgi:hypothetical protein
VEQFRPKIVDGEPVALICVIASEGRRGDKLHLYEDARLMVSELNREWPSIEHWAAPATADEPKSLCVPSGASKGARRRGLARRSLTAARPGSGRLPKRSRSAASDSRPGQTSEASA